MNNNKDQNKSHRKCFFIYIKCRIFRYTTVAALPTTPAKCEEKIKNQTKINNICSSMRHYQPKTMVKFKRNHKILSTHFLYILAYMPNAPFPNIPMLFLCSCPTRIHTNLTCIAQHLHMCTCSPPMTQISPLIPHTYTIPMIDPPKHYYGGISFTFFFFFFFFSKTIQHNG